MATTAAFSPVSGSWTEIAAGPGDCIVQMKGANPVLIHVATSAPGSEVTHGIELVANNQGVALPTLAASDKVYARGSNATSSVVVIRP